MQAENPPLNKYLMTGIHLLAWILILFIPYLFDGFDHGVPSYFLRFGILLIVTAGTYYLNYFYLVPKFLMQKRAIIYIALILLTFITGMLLIRSYFYFVVSLFEPSHHHAHFFHPVMFSSIFPGLIAVGIGTSIRLTSEWRKNERQKKEMENEKLSSELAFLKSQVNPHFLFNMLNNICSLARKKSDDTENSIIKLSQIMRYMLYDSRNEKVGLNQEVDYLNDFIELQKIRVGDRIRITFTIEGDPGLHRIEPLLLIPFVENAFKHGVSYMEDSEISILLQIRENHIFFQVSNTKSAKQESVSLEESGIGLKNLKRRLELLYPGKHIMEIKDLEENYIASIELTLTT